MNLRDIKKDIEYVIGAFDDGVRKELLEKTDALYDQLSEAVKKGLGE